MQIMISAAAERMALQNFKMGLQCVLDIQREIALYLVSLETYNCKYSPNILKTNILSVWYYLAFLDNCFIFFYMRA